MYKGNSSVLLRLVPENVDAYIRIMSKIKKLTINEMWQEVIRHYRDCQMSNLTEKEEKFIIWYLNRRARLIARKIKAEKTRKVNEKRIKDIII